MALTISRWPADVILFKLSTCDHPDEETQKVKRQKFPQLLAKKKMQGGKWNNFTLWYSCLFQ